MLKEELPDLLTISDIILSRAGATSIFEFLSLRKPSLLIPLPKSSSRGDQLLNAAIFEKAGFAEVLFQENLNKDLLYEKLNKLLKKKEEYVERMENSELGDATERVVEVVLDVRC